MKSEKHNIDNHYPLPAMTQFKPDHLTRLCHLHYEDSFDGNKFATIALAELELAEALLDQEDS